MTSETTQEHYARLDRLALESKKQCSICALMPKNECVKWHYTRQGTQGVDNRAPWCQFFKLKSIEDEHICPMCGKKKD